MSIAAWISELVGIPAILSAIVIWWLSRRMNRLDCKSETRRQENVLILKGLLTIGGLAGATARALREKGIVNGNVADDLDNYSDYKEQLSAFLVEQTVKRNN